MRARQLWFTAPGAVELREVEIGAPDEKAGQVLVEADLCGVSAGTESLLWRGEFPDSLLLDESLPALKRPADYPCPYGYSMAGRVPGRDNRVLAFAPHADRAVVEKGAWFDLPEGWEAERGILLPNAETALNLVLDAAPRMGERMVVFGLGAVGLMTLMMLSDFPLERLVGVDPKASRRERAREALTRASQAGEVGAARVDPAAPAAPAVLRGGGAGELRLLHPDELAGDAGFGDFDGVVEASGRPEALGAALEASGYDGRIVVGSWYGSKAVNLDLGLTFHRRRLRIVSSQVSTIAPGRRGRWNYRRRMKAAMDWLGKNGRASWITHRIPLANAQAAYELLDGTADYFQIALEP